MQTLGLLRYGAKALGAILRDGSTRVLINDMANTIQRTQGKPGRSWRKTLGASQAIPDVIKRPEEVNDLIRSRRPLDLGT